ncbi:type IV toxin-antitoxin system AbiEi family antitoxin domain-containing protein [Bradyrhizobium sp. USDA 10063]
MTERFSGKLNRLERTLPEGLLVDSAWMTKHGYSTGLRSQYVASGWLVQPSRGTFKRPLGTLTWQKVVISLQTLLQRPLIVGGRTALELQGFSHYLRATGPAVVYLYGHDAPPGWLFKLPLKERFTFRKSQVLFKSDPVTKGLRNYAWNVQDNTGVSADELQAGPFKQVWGQAEWPLTVSSPERALLELLGELPNNESFHQVDMLVEGLRNLSPRRLQKLLEDCKSVKVKRLFFWFAERHNHAWLKQIDRSQVDLGKGKRMLVKGGKLDPKYMITVPEDLSAPV